MTEESGQPEVTATGVPAKPGPAGAAGAAGDSGAAGAGGPAAAVTGPAAAAAGAAPETGDPRVDEALGALAGLGEVPDTEHVQAFEQVHQQLQGILGEVAGDGNPGQGHDGR